MTFFFPFFPFFPCLGVVRAIIMNYYYARMNS